MAEINARTLDEDEWQLYREVRLAALKDAPEAFVARYEDEASYDEDFWRERMVRSRRIIAERDDAAVGLVCLGLHNDKEHIGEVFGLWTAPTARGDHIARQLVTAAAEQAAAEGRKLLYFWVGSDNVPAIGFASNFGFRPTSERRPMRVADGATAPDEDEVAMVLPLSADPTLVKSPFVE